MSIQSAVGHSDYVAEPFEAGQEIAQMVLSKLSLKAHSVGILFCNIDFNFQELIKGIKSEFDVPIIGCTTASEGNNDGYFEDAASLIVITSDDTRIGTGMGTDLSKDASEAVNQATRQAMAGLNGEKPRLALTFPDITMKPISANLMLAQLVSILGPDVPIAGGLPGDSLRFKTPFQFHDGQVLTDAFPIVLFSGAIDPTIITRSGWIPVGEPARVSKAIGNVVHEIDGRPAVEYLKRYIPESLDDPQMLAIYPLAILDDSLGNDRSRYFVIRSAFSYDKDTGAVVYGGEVPEGSTVQLARGSRGDIIAGATQAAQALGERVRGREVQSVLFFSCAGRKLMLGPETKKEVEALLGEIPEGVAVNGFYSYGEIGAIDSSQDRLKSSQFHNCTLVLCAF